MTGCTPARSLISCCLTPPLPAAGGGGPGQDRCIRFVVRVSEKQPQVLHHWTVPDVTTVCFLPSVLPLPSVLDSSAVIHVLAAGLVPPHFVVASFFHDPALFFADGA